MAELKKYLDQAAAEALVANIKAADAATLESAKGYADSLASNYDAAGSSATAEANAKSYTDGQIDEVNAEVAKKAAQADLEAEALRAKAAEEANAAAAKAAQDEVDALEEVVATKAAQTDLDALAGKVGEVPEGSTVMGIITNIQENAYDDTEIQNLIAGLEANKADKTQVATDIADAVKAEEDARKEAVQDVQDELDAFEESYATDKAAIDAAIELKADKTALEAVSEVADAAATKEEFDAAVEALEAEDARIVELVEAEAAKAREEEGKLDARLVEVETFFKTAENETIDDALDTLVELQKYLEGEGAVADQMVLDIAANAKAIEDMDAAYKAADGTLQNNIDTLAGTVATKAAQADLEALDGRVTTAEGDIDALEGRMDTAEGKITTLEGEMDAVEAAVATKAEAKDLADAVAALEGADSALDERLDDIETMLGEGEGSVSDQIADAKAEAISAAADDATSKANAAEAAAKGHADSLNTAMNARVEALESIDHDHSNKAELDKIADGDVAKWNAAEANAKSYTDGKVDTINSTIEGINTQVAANKAAHEANAASITTLQTTHAEDKEALSEAIAANTSAIAAFSPISVEDINKMFA